MNLPAYKFKGKFQKTIYLTCNSFSVQGIGAIIVIVAVSTAALLAGLITVHPSNLPSGAPFTPPCVEHFLGTDDLGIDIWSQIVYGGRTSIYVGIGTALLAGVAGALAGIAAGYFGGHTERLIMRLTDIMIILPDLPLLILVGAFFGPGINNIILVLALFSWTHPARIVRSKVISIKEENYIKAAVSFGAGFRHILLRHFLPGVMPLLSVSVIRLTGRAIVAEAGLAFLGLGDPLSKSWGLILNHAINFRGIYFTPFWKWWLMPPLIAITLLVFAIALVARDLEKKINTKGVIS